MFHLQFIAPALSSLLNLQAGQADSVKNGVEAGTRFADRFVQQLQGLNYVDTLLDLLTIVAIFFAILWGIRGPLTKALNSALAQRGLSFEDELVRDAMNALRELAMVKIDKAGRSDEGPKGGVLSLSEGLKNGERSHLEKNKDLYLELQDAKFFATLEPTDQIDLAFWRFETLLDRYPEQEAVHWEYGTFLLDRGMKEPMPLKSDLFSMAVDQFRSAYKLNGESHIITHNLGVSLFRCEEYAEAAEYLQKANDQEISAESLIYLGLANWKMGEYEEAKRITEEAVKIAKDHNDHERVVKGMNNMAYYLFEIADALPKEKNQKIPEGDGEALAKAIDAIQDVVSISESEFHMKSHYWDTLGCIQLWSGDYVEAFASFKNALRLNQKPLYVEHFRRVESLLKGK